MKIIVLAGGLSTERDVSLSSAAGICRTLLEKGHDAYLLDVFMGLENPPENLEDVFTLPGHGLEIAKNIGTEEPDLEAVKASRPDQSDCFLGPTLSSCAVWLISLSWGFTEAKVKTGNFRLLLTCWVSATPVPILWAAPWPWTKLYKTGIPAVRSLYSRRSMPAQERGGPFAERSRSFSSGSCKTLLRRLQHRRIYRQYRRRI